MGKRILNLYVDDETIELAKAKKMNISKFVTDSLNIEFQNKDIDQISDKDIIISKLKTTMAMLTNELRECSEQREKISKKLLEKDREIEIKEAEVKIEKDKNKNLNEKMKRIKEDDEGGYIYS
jgi:hypothetical protein